VRNASVQGASGVPAEEAAAVDADPSLEMITQQQSGAPYQLHLNTSRPPFDDPAVREAARSALDIDAAVQALYLGVVDRAWGPLAPTSIGYDAALEGSFEFDPDAAAAALEEAGWAEGPDGVRERDGERLTVTYVEVTPNREKRQDFATFFEANLEDVGFDVETVFEQTGPLQTRQQAGEYDIMGLSLVAVDPNAMYQMYDPAFIPESGRIGFNLSHTDDAELTGLLTAGQSTLDAEARADVYAEAQAAVVDQVRSIAVYVPTYTVVLNGLTGLRFDAEGYPIFYDASLTQE
jgi:peptide/nickel transport system substrate-binding protein